MSTALILLAFSVLTICGSGSDQNQNGQPPPDADSANLEIGLPFNSSDLSTDLSTISAFFPYGPPRPTGYMDGYPAISWSASTPYTVLASAEGEVTELRDTGDDSYNITQSITDHDGWHVDYISVTDIQVSNGETLSKGQVLGEATSGGFEYYPLWWALNYEESHTCPMSYLDDTSKALAQSFLEAWNDYLDVNPDTNDPFRCYCYDYGTSQEEALAVEEADCQPSLE